MITALPDLVDRLLDRGYQIVGLDELKYEEFEEWHYEQNDPTS